MVFKMEESRSAAWLGRLERRNGARPALFHDEDKQAGSSPRVMQMLEQIIRMTQRTLNASAASILLFRDNDQELYFEIASGPVGKTLRQVKLSTQYGIAGQVARTGKPLIVNDVSRSEKFHKVIDDTTGFSTKSLICTPLTVHHRILGVLEVLNKLDGSEFDEQDLETAVSVATTAAMAIENTRLHQTVSDAYKETMSRLAAVIDTKDPYMRGHSQRVMEYTLLAGASLSLSPEEMEVLEYASVLHDIGKISVDAGVMSKYNSLTSAEQEMIREHPVIGANILKEIPSLEKASELVLYHHECFNGEGYPGGLKGEEIPLGARLIAVADAFDNMTTDRPDHCAMSVDETIE
jgi:putative methionine-R-sulfoxide reductase with GAF domain